MISTVFALTLLYSSVAGASDWQLLDGAKVHPDYRGATPRKSDVVFSTRVRRPDALEVMKAFGATRVEWVYSVDAEFINEIKHSVGWFGGTLNSNASGIGKIRPPSDDGMAKDFDGNAIAHPRMRAWGGRWITTTHPETKRVLQRQAQRYLELGVDSIQIDDPLLQLYSAYLWGGDFNPTTLAGFNKYLETYPDRSELKRLGLEDIHVDYHEFLRTRYGVKDAKDYQSRRKSLPTNGIWIKYLRQTVQDHFTKFRRFLDRSRGAAVPLSMNLSILNRPDEKNWHFFLANFADYAMAETPISDTAELVVRAATMRALGIGYVPSLKPIGLSRNRVAIATLYALGGQPVVPWDVYIGNDETGQPRRYFGSPEDYADLYRFVRNHPSVFDGKELASVVGIVIPVDKYSEKATMKLLRQLLDRRIPFAFVLVGGADRKFSIDPKRLRHFKTLITVNPDTDFSGKDLATLRTIPVPQIAADQLDEEMLRDLSPFVVAGEASEVKVYPMADAKRGSLHIHLVDEARGQQQANDAACRRRIGVKRHLLGGRRISAVTWHSGGRETRPPQSVREQSVYFSIDECVLWGVLSLQFAE